MIGRGLFYLRMANVTRLKTHWRLAAVALLTLIVIGGVSFYLATRPTANVSCASVTVQHVPTVDPSLPGHRTYQLVPLGPLPYKQHYQPGETLRFAWCPVADNPTSDGAPSQVTITGQLAGPFGTQAAAQAAQLAYHFEGQDAPDGEPPTPLQPVAGIMASFSTDTWDGSEHASTLTLPQVPGFYIFVLTTATVAPAGSTGLVSSVGGPTGIVEVAN
jgi:hypothetical protein